MRLPTFSCLLLAVLFLGGLAEPVFAWGPATHIALGNAILSQLAMLPAAVAAILAKNATAYLYGNIAADIVFAKRMSRVKQFCHHWSTALRVLNTAPDDRGKAFAYGYLSHLAADTVAHGKYIPRQIMMSDCSVNFGHFYWELRADAAQPAPVWGLVEDVMAEDHDHHHVELSGHLTETLLSYEVNRVLFERMNGLALRPTFRRTIDTFGRFSRHDLPPALLSGYHRECVDRMLCVLSSGAQSPLLREDPNGTSALTNVKFQRRLARKHRAGHVHDRRRELANCWTPRAAFLSGSTAAVSCHSSSFTKPFTSSPVIPTTALAPTASAPAPSALLVSAPSASAPTPSALSASAPSAPIPVSLSATTPSAAIPPASI